MNRIGRLLEIHNRNKIYEFILKYPGVHQRQIIRNFDLSEGTVKYHLRVLLKENLIVEKKINGYKRFYKQGKNGKFEQKIIAILREKIPCFILLFLLRSVVSTTSEISREMDKDPATILFHINKLLEMNLVEKVTLENGLLLTKERKRKIIRDMKSREVIYRVKQYTLTYRYFLKYKKYFLDDNETKNLVDFLTYFGKEHKNAKNINIKNINNQIDNITDIIYETFPIPWCA